MNDASALAHRACGRVRGRGFVAFAVLALAAVHCGGGTPSASSPAAAGPDPASPAGRCLAIAGVKRERKADEPAKVGVRHLLVAYAGAKRAAPTVTRTREEACLRALAARDEVRGGGEFVEAVKKYSDEPGAATRGGSIGAIERKGIAPPFADAAFELGTGEFSDVVETEFGFHVIMRTD